MGAINGKRQDVAPENPPYQNNREKNYVLKDYKPGNCCGRYNVEIGAIFVAVIELCFIIYQVIIQFCFRLLA